MRVDALNDLHVIVPAGGAGTRLWPLSRAGHPKFLIDLTGTGRTLLQQTWDRLTALVEADRVHVVTGRAHAEAVRDQLPGLRHLLAEPTPRDSMPAIGLAAAVIERRSPGAVVGSFAADHVITGDDLFADAVGHAVAAAREGLVATIGITPTEPATAFGYIEAGAPLGTGAAFAITRFVEKPDATTAAGYVASGRFSWNAGMFVSRADVLLGHLARHRPALHDALVAIADEIVTSGEIAVGAWEAITGVAIDHAIAEPVSLEGGMAVVPGRFGWSDVGDVDALAELIDEPGADVTWVDADGLVLTDDDTHVAVVGLHDVVVIRSGGALLVTTREHAQRVKDVPAALRAAGRDDLV